MKKEKIKQFYKENEQYIKQITFGFLGSAITAATIYYLDTRPLSKNKRAFFYINIIEETGEVLLGVTNRIQRGNKYHDYRGCFGACKTEDAIKIGTDIIELANSVINKENQNGV